MLHMILNGVKLCGSANLIPRADAPACVSQAEGPGEGFLLVQQKVGPHPQMLFKDSPDSSFHPHSCFPREHLVEC